MSRELSVVERAEVRGAEVSPARVVGSLARRELVRFFRQRNRVIGALAQPILFWVLFAAGFGPSFQMPGAASSVRFGQFFFPGTIVLIVLFTAIFTTISVIEDRREGFLQSVLVAPIPRWTMVAGKLIGGAAVAWFQAVLFFALGLALSGPLELGLNPGLIGTLGTLILAAVLSLGLTALGFLFAWRSESVQGFHAIMSVVLFPLWLLSGALFPASAGVLGWIVKLNPLSYGVAGMRHLGYWRLADPPLPPGTPSAAASFGVTALATLVLLALAWRAAGARSSGDLP